MEEGEDISDHLQCLPGIQHSVTVNVVQAERPLEEKKNFLDIFAGTVFIIYLFRKTFVYS